MTYQGKIKIRTSTNVYNFWENEGKNRGSGILATLRDHHFRYIEIVSILKEIKKKNNHLLDIGCGNGVSTFFFAPFSKKVTAIDYSKNLIKNAKKFQKVKNFKKLVKSCDYNDLKTSYQNINFEHGNILNLSDYINKFDLAVCSRVLINLGTPNQQKQAMKNVYDSLKKNSLFIVNEVEAGNHKKLSKLREANGLESLEKYWHNLYLKEKTFLRDAKKMGFKLVKKMQYGEYQILSKVMYPKMIEPQTPNFMSKFNKFAADIFLNNKNLTKEIINNFFGNKIKDLKSPSHQTGYVFKKV
jgi:SAM-dependent methyltransferase